MCRSSTYESWHQEYAFKGWIPTRISVAVIQIRARSTAFHAAEHDWPFADEFPMA